MKVNLRRLWQTLLIIAVLTLVVGMAVDGKDVERYSSQMEQYMAEGNYAEALKVGAKSDKTDARLLRLRIEALGHEHLLGERLFTFPVAGSSGDMAKKRGDEELCAYLIDKRLDDFVRVLPKYYPVDERLPRHYREALVLYRHLRAHPQIVYYNEVMDTDYMDMQEMERKYRNRSARQVAVERQYNGTYWYYYEYLNKN